VFARRLVSIAALLKRGVVDFAVLLKQRFQRFPLSLARIQTILVGAFHRLSQKAVPVRLPDVLEIRRTYHGYSPLTTNKNVQPVDLQCLYFTTSLIVLQQQKGGRRNSAVAFRRQSPCTEFYG
jgi:hypothetical protein